jgi:hypothetical protein
MHGGEGNYTPQARTLRPFSRCFALLFSALGSSTGAWAPPRLPRATTWAPYSASALTGPFVSHLYWARSGQADLPYILRTHSRPISPPGVAHKGIGGVVVLDSSSRRSARDTTESLTPPHRRPQSGELQREQRRVVFEPPNPRCSSAEIASLRARVYRPPRPRRFESTRPPPEQPPVR